MISQSDPHFLNIICDIKFIFWSDFVCLMCSFRNMHNNLRITRILKSLGELGFEHYQAPLVQFFLEETLVKKNLSSVKRSVLDYFLFAVRNKRKRRDLISYAFQHFEPKDKFVWCPRRIQKRLKKKAEAKRQESPSRNKRDGENREEDEPARMEGSSVDPEPKDEGSSVDPEPNDEGSSVDPEPKDDGSSTDMIPMNNGNHIDNGEMDVSAAETNTKSDEDEENVITPDTESTSFKSDQDMTQVKDVEETKNISLSQKGSSFGTQVSQSPKHTLKSSPRFERAGKLARTKESASLRITDYAIGSGDAPSSPEKPGLHSETNGGEKTNGTDTAQLMETEPCCGNA